MCAERGVIRDYPRFHRCRHEHQLVIVGAVRLYPSITNSLPNVLPGLVYVRDRVLAIHQQPHIVAPRTLGMGRLEIIESMAS